MREDWYDGLVMRLQSGFYAIRLDGRSDGDREVQAGQEVICHLRGRLKRGRFGGDILAIGDHVKVSLQSAEGGMIEEVQPRQQALVRLSPMPHGEYRQILLANADQVIMVFACAQPQPHLRMLDRFLVICEKQGIPAVIIANKVDLVGMETARQIFGLYPSLGYPVIYTSVKDGQGLVEVHDLLVGKISGLAGSSGVGKSSLLNAIQPDLGLAVRSVNDVTEKGRHTTVVRQLFTLNEGGFVADLPGLKSLALWDTEPEELDGYFPELRDLVSVCQYNDCTHRNEPGCAVKDALEHGRVSPERYQSYLRMRFGGEDSEF